MKHGHGCLVNEEEAEIVEAYFIDIPNEQKRYPYHCKGTAGRRNTAETGHYVVKYYDPESIEK